MSFQTNYPQTAAFLRGCEASFVFFSSWSLLSIFSNELSSATSNPEGSIVTTLALALVDWINLKGGVVEIVSSLFFGGSCVCKEAGTLLLILSIELMFSIGNKYNIHRWIGGHTVIKQNVLGIDHQSYI